MHTNRDTLYLSPTDLSITWAAGIARSSIYESLAVSSIAPVRHDPHLELLIERGLRHEQAVVDRLRAEGRDVTDLRDVEGVTALERTRTAMHEGREVIVQPVLSHGRWQGRADLLLRVGAASAGAPFTYEVADTKLARQTRGGTILQLCLYTDLVASIVGRPSVRMHVIKPGEPPVWESFRFEEFAAYYRLVRRRLEDAVAPPHPDTDSELLEHCEICSWFPHCDAERRERDDLCFVAGMQQLHKSELLRQETTTLEGFAERTESVAERPQRGSRETFDRLHGQAAVQLRGRREERPVHELLPLKPDRGFLRLPAPSPGDVYFDLESDGFVEGGGLEYLFGYALRREDGGLDYHGRWGLDRSGERKVFEEFIDLVMARWRRHGDLYVYHFAPYEPAALKRLMGRYTTRENEINELLRAERFVDLHAITRQAVRASVERYSLKDLERFTGYEREVELPRANRALRVLEWDLELGTGAEIDEGVRRTVEGYNRDDCVSTAVLQEWLEGLRSERIAAGDEIPRPESKAGDASEEQAGHRADVRAVYERLTDGLPGDSTEDDDRQRAGRLLADLLEYFWREELCAWWEFYRMHELEHEDLREERKAVAGLVFETRAGGTDRCPVHRYRFPTQEAALDPGDTLYAAGDADRELGTVIAVDQAARTVEIKKRGVSAGVHPDAAFVHRLVRARPMPGSLLQLGRSVADLGIDGDGPCRAARDLLLRRAPRLGPRPVGALRRTGESTLDASKRLSAALRESVLAIQGPPGSGKTYTGGEMIAALARSGKRVGVTALSHKVIRNLLASTVKAARRNGAELRLVHKARARSEEPPDGIEEVTGNDEALASLDEGAVVGGTAWLWARDDAAESLDYLFVDEAGQLSLAHVLAASRSARNLVLLGDPRQLEQPQQGTHPEGAACSALEHLLGERETIPDELGLFLDQTWRLHPEICEFTSETYYEGRLTPRDGLETQRILGVPGFENSGLYFVPVPHAGNQNSSTEEADVVAELIRRFTTEEAQWIHADEGLKPLRGGDVLIVTPYNAQVGAIAARLPEANVGTVDKFQGQEAPVVIYSMASSSVEDAPRGMGFVFNPNRVNVATSRARCVCVLIASPALLEPDCRTPEQMRQANGICRFLELARERTFP